MADRAVLIFEWLCGGGLHLDQIEPAAVPELLDQGRQMLVSVAQQFAVAGWTPVVPIDNRVDVDVVGQAVPIDRGDQLSDLLKRLANEATWVLVIAPETDDTLLKCLNWLAGSRAKLLNASNAAVRLATDKNQMQQHLADHGIPVPRGCPVSELIADLDHPLRHCADFFVAKPADGCGGEDHIRMRPPVGLRLLTHPRFQTHRIEEWIHGTPVSVSVVAGPELSKPILLSPLRQNFNRPTRTFLRCTDDLPSDTSARATRLAEKTSAVLPVMNGWYGIDMVIGEKEAVIEVNPRVTMSWPILAAEPSHNLAELLVTAFAVRK